MAFSKVLGACALLVILATGTAARADPWNIVVINSTGKTIYKIQIAPAATTSWTSATLAAMNGAPAAQVPNGDRVEAHFDRPDSICRYDLKTSFTDQSTATFSGVNVCDNSYVTLKFSNGKAVFVTN